MSILPSHSHQGSASSNFNSQNPNFNHGNFTSNQEQHQQLHQSPNLGVLRISEEGQSSPNSGPGSMGEAAGNGSGSSKKMTGKGNPNGWKASPNQSINDRGHCDSVAQGGIGSPQSNGEVSSSPLNGRASGSARRRSQIANGNHLLNFQYNPISRPQQRGPPLRKPQKMKPYNKDLFLQANYRFVVLDSGNYTLDSMDPDKMLHWEDIICVRYSTPQPVQCPICLDTPLCPQITSCGHIFCFPCILQYLLMGEDNHKAECWRKCPLCFMMISTKDLYTIYIENVREHSVGETLDFLLLTRKKDSFSLQEKSRGGMNGKTCDSFSKFILTRELDLSVREAISALDHWLVRADSGLVDDLEKLPYVCAAMEHLKQRKKYWNSHQNIAGSTSYKIVECKDASARHPSSEADEHQDGALFTMDDANKGIDNAMTDVVNGDVNLVQSSDTDESLEGQEVLSSLYDESKNVKIQADASTDAKERDSYSFYQAVDGQPIILHPLNMKCLLHHYGRYDLLPTRVAGKILQLECVTQSEAIRKRYRYLSHFPLTTTFQLCEIDLREVMPSDALSPFMDEITKREKQRKLLAKKEREERNKAEAVAAYSLPVPYNLVHSSLDGSSLFSMDDFEALGSSSPTVVSSPPVYGGRQLFANVARLGFAAGCDSPSLNLEETSPQSNVERTNSTGGLSGTCIGSASQSVRSFANIISRENSTETRETRKTNEAGKKGKKQSRVLFSTAGGRRY